MINIALMFHSASNDNLGVGALTVSEVEILRRIARRTGLELHVTILDSLSARPAYVSGGDVTLRPTRPLRRPHDFFAAIRKADLVIDIGGGDSFADIYGRRRLGQMFLMKFLTHLAGRPLVLAPQTFGPFRRRTSIALARATLSRCVLVATRDRMSTGHLREIGYCGEVVEASDVALRLPWEPPSPRQGSGPVRVGINVSGLLMSGGYTRDNMFGLRMDYPDLMRELIRGFLDHPEGCEVHLVAHVIGWPPGAGREGALEDDHAANLALARAFPGVIVAPPFASPSEAKSYIAGLDFFVGARMHACIAAFSSGVPVVPMAYSRKFAGLFGSLGYDETLDCVNVDAPEACRQIFRAFAERARLREAARKACRLGLERLDAYEARLEGFLVRQPAR